MSVAAQWQGCAIWHYSRMHIETLTQPVVIREAIFFCLQRHARVSKCDTSACDIRTFDLSRCHDIWEARPFTPRDELRGEIATWLHAGRHMAF